MAEPRRHQITIEGGYPHPAGFKSQSTPPATAHASRSTAHGSLLTVRFTPFTSHCPLHTFRFTPSTVFRAAKTPAEAGVLLALQIVLHFPGIRAN